MRHLATVLRMGACVLLAAPVWPHDAKASVFTPTYAESANAWNEELDKGLAKLGLDKPDIATAKRIATTWVAIHMCRVAPNDFQPPLKDMEAMSAVISAPEFSSTVQAGILMGIGLLVTADPNEGRPRQDLCRYVKDMAEAGTH